MKVAVSRLGLIFFSMVLLVASCKKDSNNSSASKYNPVPLVTVNIPIDLNLPQYQKLNYMGGYVYIDNAGYKGIVVVHDYNDQFVAMDRACPFHPTASCAKLVADNSGLNFICGTQTTNGFLACCDSKYDLDGFKISGSTQYNMKRYTLSKDGTSIYISN
jgi:hypothetical protein